MGVVSDEESSTPGAGARKGRIVERTLTPRTWPIRSVLQRALGPKRTPVAKPLLQLHLGSGHLWSALAYVERNPVRAGMVEAAVDYPWSSAAAHVSGVDPTGSLDMAWWRSEGPKNWSATLNEEQLDAVQELRRCTYMRDGHSEAQTLYERSARESGEPGFVVDRRRKHRSLFR